MITNIKKLPVLALLLLFGCSSTLTPTPTATSARWLTTETNHLILHYQPGSYAAKNINIAAAKYDRSYRLALRSLPFVKNRAKLDVYLHNSLQAAGHANRENRSSHYVYAKKFQLTSAHEMMHHFLYEMNPNVPLRFEEGLCRFFEFRTIFTNRARLYQLAKLAPARMWDVNEVFKDAYKTDAEGNVAAAFAAFFMQTLGQEKFWQFYGNLRKDFWGRQLEDYFNKDMAAINTDFQTFMRNMQDPPAIFKRRGY